MRYGILGDIHGNIEALTAVLDACREEGVRRYFCIGDIVGYGANPKECIETLKELKIVSVAGNHDWAVSGNLSPVNFNSVAKESVTWTKKQLTKEHLDFLKDLELVFYHDDFILVHGTLHKPRSFTYLFDINTAPDTFYLMDRNVCFIGHTHVPQILVKRGEEMTYEDTVTVEEDEQSKYIVNVGSVGQPRDGSPLSSYCIYDPDLHRIQIKRVSYDVLSAQKRIIEEGLPEILSKRLAVGQ